MPTLLPLTRSASLDDFPACPSAALWQQVHAIDAYQRWTGGPYKEPPGRVLCLNWGAAQFHAPGLDPVYRYHNDPESTIDKLAAVFALSVLDRVDAPLRFLRQTAERLLPGGLIICTYAAWDATGRDCAVGHELRKRIYDRESWRKLLHDVRGLGLEPFGGVDLRHRGNVFGDHTLASLVIRKERL